MGGLFFCLYMNELRLNNNHDLELSDGGSISRILKDDSDAFRKESEQQCLCMLKCEEGESFYSIPFGWSGGGSAYTNTYFAAGLAGLKSGRKEGGWMFPLFNYKGA